MSRTLQDRLDAIREGFEKKAPAEAVTVMHRATQALVDAGRAESALGEDDVAPAFALADSAGARVRSGDLLNRGPLIVTFFRGHW